MFVSVSPWNFAFFFFNPKSDIVPELFAFPIVLILSSNLLYEENEQGIFDAVLRGHIDFTSKPWPTISSSAKDLVKKMLRADPRERLSAVDVLSKSDSSCKHFFYWAFCQSSSFIF